jgi:hypothetical protein
MPERSSRDPSGGFRFLSIRNGLIGVRLVGPLPCSSLHFATLENERVAAPAADDIGAGLAHSRCRSGAANASTHPIRDGATCGYCEAKFGHYRPLGR